MQSSTIPDTDLRSALATFRLARNGALAAGAAACALLAPFAPGAAAALALGCGVSVLGGSLLVQAMRALLASGSEPAQAQRRAAAGALVRYPLMGVLLYLGVSARLPAPWIAAGASAWPLALLVAALVAATGPTPAPAGAAAPRVR